MKNILITAGIKAKLLINHTKKEIQSKIIKKKLYYLILESQTKAEESLQKIEFQVTKQLVRDKKKITFNSRLNNLHSFGFHNPTI
jgi:hypothetical protein